MRLLPGEFNSHRGTRYPSHMGSLGKVLGTLSADPQAKGREFELLARWYLTNAPEYASTVEQVWLWDEWPERWGTDAGIDLVVKTRHDTLWAVQAKAYGSDYSVTKRDLDSFLSESSRPDFQYRLLMATTDRIGGTALRTLSAQEKPVGSLMLTDLETSVVAWPESIDDLQPTTITRATPRPHQREAIDAAVAGLKEHDRGKVVMACGTGKTYVGLWLHEELESDLTLVLVPSLSLLKQTLREWTTHKNTDFDHLAICSDETVDQDERTDSFVSSTTALGVPVTTDVGEIGRFLGAYGPRVVFSTYQSSPRLAEAMAVTPGARFDLTIADEAHRCTGPATSAFSTVLDDSLIPTGKRIFMTATPRYYTTRVRRKAAERDLDLASMDDEDAFGPDFYTLLFAEAIEKGLLSDYRVLVVGVSNAMYHEYAERGESVRFDGDRVTDARTLAREIGLAKAIRQYDLKRTLTFHNRVKGAEEFARELPAVIEWMPDSESPTDAVACDYVSGKMNAGDREVRLRRLRTLDQTDRVVLSNARCLAEGVDVPGIDAVAFIDPRRSQVDILQAVGRALRLSEDKTVGTVVISVFVEDGEDAEDAVESSEFNPVWQVIRALRSHDPTIGESLDLIRAINADGQTPITSADLPDRIEVDLPVGVGADFSTAFAARLVTETTSSWEVGFGFLSDYVAREGNADVPYEFISESGFKLGNWVSQRRADNRANRLPSDRAFRLSRLPGWDWKLEAGRRLTTRKSFEDAFAALRSYVAREGHAEVPARFKDEAGFALGTWVRHRRVDYWSNRLSPGQISRLEEMSGWVWGIGNSDSTSGRETEPQPSSEQRFAALQKYVAREGHAAVPTLYVDESGLRLGGWVARNLKDYRAGRLSPDVIARLEEIDGWDWGRTRAGFRFEDMLVLLQKYVAREGHAAVPTRYVDESGLRLGRWVARIRSDYRAGRLSPDVIARLEEIDGWDWGGARAGFRFEDMLVVLQRYVAREGHARVPDDHIEDGFNLGPWVRHRRSDHRGGTLAEEWVERLEELPGWSWGRTHGEITERFEAVFELLQRYVAREGHARVPDAHIEEAVKLGLWVRSRRAEYRAGRLRPERAAQLEAQPGWSWGVSRGKRHGGTSGNQFEVLQRFVAREGHARVPAKHSEEGVRLGVWVSNNRQRYKAGRLPPDHIARLEALQGWVWDASRDRGNRSRS